MTINTKQLEKIGISVLWFFLSTGFGFIQVLIMWLLAKSNSHFTFNISSIYSNGALTFFSLAMAFGVTFDYLVASGKKNSSNWMMLLIIVSLLAIMTTASTTYSSFYFHQDDAKALNKPFLDGVQILVFVLTLFHSIFLKVLSLPSSEPEVREYRFPDDSQLQVLINQAIDEKIGKS